MGCGALLAKHLDGTRHGVPRNHEMTKNAFEMNLRSREGARTPPATFSGSAGLTKHSGKQLSEQDRTCENNSIGR